MSRVLIACCLTLTFAAQPATPETKELDPELLVGVWRMCFEPGLPGVDEPDRGYLVLLPDDRYIKMTDTVESPRITETGIYEITPEGVVLRGAIRQAPDGSTAGGPIFKPRPLRFEPSRTVVLGATDEAPVVEAPVLMPGKTANYAYARVF